MGTRQPSANHFAFLPAVDVVADGLRAEGLPAAFATRLARQAVNDVRQRLQRGDAAFDDAAQALTAVRARAAAAARAATALPVPSVINATGTILHTGLGRAPLSRRAQAALQAVMDGYCQLEFALADGERGDRQTHVEPLLRYLTGCEAGLVVNNCAGALVLVLQALAQGREVIVSRGELVEIGGSFRIPEIMRSAGCRLVEVGTTNKTRLEDYRQAITADTALLLKVHKSNFTQEGFVTEVSAAELVGLGAERGLPVVVDQGSGCVADLSPLDITTSRLADELATGVGLVCSSGDKLLGGPQAGLILGAAPLVARCKRHPLARALRVDKLVLAALAGTLQDYLLGDPQRTVPTLAMLFEPLAAVTARAERLCAAIAEVVTAHVVDGQSAVGSGATPTQGVATAVVRIDLASPERLAQRLRLDPAHVVGRVSRGALLLDLRTVREDQVEQLAAAVRRCCQERCHE